ncbi:hypothetical protein [Bordetella sp. LUAb4]|uniref:hypothetical protein n=1 Tax=Bordetella sp. LUAb4 TaxID=2843195 RepID=UPI001E58AC2B|nr:hypothetical protein [Bordetella sp. LUAb4]
MQIDKQTYAPTPLADNDTSSTAHSALEGLGTMEGTGEEGQGKQLKIEMESADSWLGKAWGSVRETANSVFMKAEHATSPFMQGEWDEKIGTAVRSIAAGGIQINSPKQCEFDTKLGAVLRTAGLMAAGGQSLALHLPQNRRA